MPVQNHPMIGRFAMLFRRFLPISLIVFFSTAQAQKQISNSSAGIVGKVVTAYDTLTKQYTNTTAMHYQLGYFAGMQCIGDIDKDGEDDYAIASWTDDYNTANRSTYSYDNGMVYVFFGRADSNYWQQANIKNLPVEEKADMVLCHSGGWTGWYLSGLGDVNGDKIDDFAISASADYWDVNKPSGRVFILFGKAKRGDWHLEDTVHSNTTIYGLPIGKPRHYKYKNLKIADGGIADYEFRGRNGHADRFGRNVSNAGDIDGDGANDLLIGASGWTDDTINNRKGKVYIVRGMKGNNTVNWGSSKEIVIDNVSNTTVPYISYRSSKDFEMLGYGLAGLGDMNMDGIDDVLFGGDNSDNGVHSSDGLPQNYKVGTDTFWVSYRDNNPGNGEISSYNLGKAYMVFGRDSFFKDWDTRKNQATTDSAHVTFISGYKLETDLGKKYRWSNGIGTILARGGYLCKNPNYNPAAIISPQNPYLLNSLMLSEPFHDVDNAFGRASNYGKAYVFFAKPSWASVYDFSSPASPGTWQYFSLINYGQIIPRNNNDTLLPRATGMGLQGVGDVNADGYEDVVIASHYDDNPNDTAVTLVLGTKDINTFYNNNSDIRVRDVLLGPGSDLKNQLKVYVGNKTESYPIVNGNTDTILLTGLGMPSKPGDINGDGLLDLVFTDYQHNPDNTQQAEMAGKAYIDLQRKKEYDLWAKDDVQDNGAEPRPPGLHWNVFESPDITHRVNFVPAGGFNTSPALVPGNGPFDSLAFENPDPKNVSAPLDTNNHAFVRIRNRGSEPSPANQYKVCLYWTLAQAGGEQWPRAWTGNQTDSFALCTDTNQKYLRPIGGFIGSYTLPAISGSSSLCIDFPWSPPAPNRYASRAQDSCKRLDVCLLARIVKADADNSPQYPRIKAETGLAFDDVEHLATQVRQNNKVVTRNLVVVDKAQNGTVEKTGAIRWIAFENEYAFDVHTVVYIRQSLTYDNLFSLGNNSFYTLGLPDVIYNLWAGNGRLGHQVADMYDTDSLGLHLIKIYGSDARLEGVVIPSGQLFRAVLAYQIDGEYTLPEDFDFEAKLSLGLQADTNHPAFTDDIKYSNYEQFDSYWLQLGGINYNLHLKQQ